MLNIWSTTVWRNEIVGDRSDLAMRAEAIKQFNKKIMYPTIFSVIEDWKREREYLTLTIYYRWDD